MKDGQIESVVQNKKTATTQTIPKDTDSETAAIQKAYPYLDNSQIEAKLILNQILSPYSIETQQQMEESISQFIKGKLTQKQLVQLFDKPVESGGFSLYKQTAINIGQRVSELTKNISIFKNEPKNETDLEKRVTKVTDYLIEKYQLNLNFNQVKKLKELLTDRFNFKLPENRFNQKIDQPLADGGLGLNARTSKKIAREVKLIMFNKKFKEDAN
jgi:hypothetical protein